VAPITTLINTVASSYHFFGFAAETSSWPGTTTSNCGDFTVLRPTGSAITTTHTLGIHYQIRVRVAFWSMTGSASTLNFEYSTTNGSYLFQNTSPASVDSKYGTLAYDATCTGAYALNFEQYVNDSNKAAVDVQVKFTSPAASWGINQYIFIEYLCSQPDCGSCVGPGSNNCTSCASTIKALYSSPGTCLCNFTMGYYAYPTGNSTYYCVNPCPNLPSGQYYGDNFTKACVLSCPADTSNTAFWSLSFASDEHGFCVSQCPSSIKLGQNNFSLYYDLVGRKCTT
jgi:hypothetical protein